MSFQPTVAPGVTPNSETAKRRTLLSSALADFITKEQARRHQRVKPGAKEDAPARDHRFQTAQVNEGGPTLAAPVTEASQKLPAAAKSKRGPVKVRPKKGKTVRAAGMPAAKGGKAPMAPGGMVDGPGC